MKKLLILSLLIAAVFSFAFSTQAKQFIAQEPAQSEVMQAILDASEHTLVRSVLLYGLYGQETNQGKNLGRTENEWRVFCANKKTKSCDTWSTKDCKYDYDNAKHYDDILKELGYVDIQGNVDKTGIPTSETCALGFTQFEPSTWWEVKKQRTNKVYNPWDIHDAVLMAAYYLQDLGADKNENLRPNEFIGVKDRIALQRYYCGGNYTRLECIEYANGVVNKSRQVPEELHKADLLRQLEFLKALLNTLQQQVNEKLDQDKQQENIPSSLETPEIPAQQTSQPEQPKPQPSVQWKTIDKTLFSIKIPETWNETASLSGGTAAQDFRLRISTGEYFGVEIDPSPTGFHCTDMDWKLKTNSSGDGVVIEKEITAQSSEMCGNAHGDSKLNIAAFAKDSNSQNIPIQGHVYYFFFGNDKRETGVDTEIFKEILASFRAKKATNQKLVMPPTSEKVVRIIANNVPLLTTNGLGEAPLGEMIGAPVARLSDKRVWGSIESAYFLNRGDILRYISEKDTRGDL